MMTNALVRHCVWTLWGSPVSSFKMYERFNLFLLFKIFMLLVYLGNIIEWCIPEETDLDGVEFKAMTSGSHTLDNDFV